MRKVYDFDIPDDDYFLRLADGKEIEIEEQERKINLYKKSGLEIFLGW